MAGNLERLSVVFSTNISQYRKDMSTASRSTKDWASDTDKAAASAQDAAKKSQGAFSKITQAIRGMRSEAQKGAEFKLKSDEGGLSRITNKIKGLRSDAAKGASFAVKTDERGFSGIASKIKGIRSDASKGATFSIRSDTSQLKAAGSMIGSVRSDASRGASMKLSVDTSGLDSARDSIKSISETAGGVAGGMALEDVGSGIADNMREASMATGGFEARLGASQKQAEALSGVGKNVFRGAWGDSLADVNSAVTTVAQGLGTMGNAARTQKLTEQALTLSDAYGIDVTESVESARQMSQNLGISSERAFDLIAAGAQNGANKSGDLADSLREYSPMFGRLGISGSQAMGMFVEGAKNGIWNTDRLGDALKEFSIRAVDGSDTTAQGFKMAGLNAKQMSTDIAAGGPRAEAAFQKTVSAIQSIEDPQKRAQAGVKLFGTLYEDVGTAGLQAMNKGAQGMNNVDGAAKRTGDSLYNNFTTRMMGATRSIQTFMSDSGAGAMGGALSGITENAGFAGMAVLGLGPIATRTAPILGGAFTAALGPVGLAIIGIAALAGGLYFAYQKSETFRNAVNGLAKVVGGVATRGFQELMAVGAPVLKFFGNLGGGILANAQEKLGGFWGTLFGEGKSADGAKSKIGGFFSWVGQKASESKGLNSIWTKLSDDRGAIDNAKKRLGPFFSYLGDKAQNSPGLNKIWGKLRDDKGAVENAQARIGKMTAWITQKAQSSPGLQKIWTKLSDDKGALDNVKARIGQFGGWLGNKWTQIGEGTSKKWTGIKVDVGNAASGMADRVITGANRLKTGALGKFEEMRSGSHGRFAKLAADGVANLADLEKRGLARTASFVKGGLDKYTELRQGGATRFEALEGTISNRLATAKRNGISRTHEMGTELKTSWGRQWEDSQTKFGNIRDTIGSRLSTAKERGLDAIHALGGGLSKAWENQLAGARGFGDKFKGILGDKFGGAVNTARGWLGGLMIAVGNVLGVLGADGLAGDAKSRGNKLQEPLKFARGGISTGNRGGVGDGSRIVAITNEAGPEAIVPLSRRTPQGQEALRVAMRSPNAPREYRTGGVSVPPRDERENGKMRKVHKPLGFAEGGLLTSQGWDLVRGDHALPLLSDTSYGSQAHGAISDWSRSISKPDVQDAGSGSAQYVRIHDQGLAPGTLGLTSRFEDGSGDIKLDPSKLSSYNSSEIQGVVAHEIGHALGLPHRNGRSLMNTAADGDQGHIGMGINSPTSLDIAEIKRIWPGSTGKPVSSGGSVSGSGFSDKLSNYPTKSPWNNFVGQVAGLIDAHFPTTSGTYPGHEPDEQHAIDSMVPNRSMEPGNSIADFEWSNRDAIGMDYQIWRQRFRMAQDNIYGPANQWNPMSSRGSDTDNHYDHVHSSYGTSAGSGSVRGVGVSGGGGFDWMSAITSGLAKVGAFPDMNLGIVGDGMKSFAGTLMSKAKDFLVTKAKSIFDSVSTLGNTLIRGEPREWAKAGLEYGGVREPSLTNVNKILELAKKESSLKPDAVNPTSVGGEHASGFMQMLPSTFRANAVKSSDDIFNAVHNVASSSRYQVGRYGDLTTQSPYLRGGVIPGAKGKPVLAQAHAGERVLSEKNNEAFERLARSVEIWSTKTGDVGPGGTDKSYDRGMERMERRLKSMEDVLERQLGRMATARERADEQIHAVRRAIAGGATNAELDHIISEAIS